VVQFGKHRQRHPQPLGVDADPVRWLPVKTHIR
jgi:hypothetical protein